VIWSGGKGRPGDYLAADHPQAAGERQPVGVQVLGQRGGVQHLAQGVVDQQVRPDLLGDQLGVRERSTCLGPRWVVFNSPSAVSTSHRWVYSAASSWAGAAVGSQMVVTSR
jgi:hypothetical protein